MQPKKRASRRPEMIKAAFKELAAGQLKLNLFERISQRLKISRSNVDYHFGSQAALLREMMEMAFESARASTQEALLSSDTPNARLIAIADGAMNWGKSNPLYARAFSFLHWIAQDDPAVRKELEATYAAGQERLARVLLAIRLDCLKAMPSGSPDSAKPLSSVP